MRQNQRHLVQPSGLTDRINKTFCKLNTGYYDLSSLQAGKIKSHRFCRCCWLPDGCPNPQRCRPSAWLKVGLQLLLANPVSLCVQSDSVTVTTAGVASCHLFCSPPALPPEGHRYCWCQPSVKPLSPPTSSPVSRRVLFLLPTPASRVPLFQSLASWLASGLLDLTVGLCRWASWIDFWVSK